MRLLHFAVLWVAALCSPALHAASPYDTRSCETVRDSQGMPRTMCVSNTYTNAPLWLYLPEPGTTSPPISPHVRFWKDTFGQDDDPAPVRLRIVHINGIATTRDSALGNLKAIMTRVIETTTFLCAPVGKKLAYNRSRPDPLLGTPVNDLMEVAVQKHRENPNTRFSDLVRLIYLADTAAAWLGRSTLPMAVVHAALQGLDEWYRRANTWVDSDLRDIAADIRPHLRDGERVLLVPHSQGNLFANMVTGALADVASDERQLRQVGIASPAAQVQRGSYRSSVNDTVLQKLAQVSTVLPPNLDIPANELARSLDPRGHNLVDIYLNPELPGLADIRAEATKALQEMVGMVRGQCLKAIGLLSHYKSVGQMCDPLTFGITSEERVSVHAVDIGIRQSQETNIFGDASGPPPTSMLNKLTRTTNSLDRKGRWRIAGHDEAQMHHMRTIDDTVCNNNQAHKLYWAFIFDAAERER